MASSTKDLAILCKLLDDSEKNVILSRIAPLKKNDVLSDLAHLRHVRIKESQYVSVLAPFLVNIKTGNSATSEHKYFKPHNPRVKR